MSQINTFNQNTTLEIDLKSISHYSKKFQKKDIKITNSIEIINDQNNIDQICMNIGTIPYEVLTKLGYRYSRIYK